MHRRSNHVRDRTPPLDDPRCGRVVLDEGRIAERGIHEELLEAEGTYANFWRVQAGEIDELPREFIERAIERGSQADAGVGSE